MGRVDGRVVVRESGHAVPDVAVCVCRLDVDGRGFEGAKSQADLVERLGSAIASALTDSDGHFVLTWEHGESREDAHETICLVVFAPEDVTNAERPLAAPAGEALLFMSRPIQTDGALRRTMLVRLLQAQVRKAGIELCRPPTRACDELLEQMAARSRRAKEERGSRVDLGKRREHILDVRRQARTLVGDLHALPAHIRAARNDGESPVIFGKSKLAKQLPDAQAKVVENGFARMRELRRSVSLRLSPALAAQLGLSMVERDGHSDDGQADFPKVEPTAVAKVVREATAGCDLVRRRARPSAGQLDRLSKLVFADEEESDDE